MNQELLNDYYKSFSTGKLKCLYPGYECKNKSIRAHSIQNSKVFDLLQADNHLIGIKLKTNNMHIPVPTFDRIGRNKASTFYGLCEAHDKALFQEIDDNPFDIKNSNHLFILAYRSIIKELHASIDKAIKVQSAYLKKKELSGKKIVDDSDDGLFAVQHIVNSFETYEYKNEIDTALLNQNFDFLSHQIIELKTIHPIVACSQLFSIDSVKYKDSVARIIMNIFPVKNNLTYAIFSSTINEENIRDEYLYKCLRSDSQLQKYELSKMIIRNSENFFFNPNHIQKWSEIKKKKILEYFVSTIYEDKDYDDIDYYIF